MAKKKNTRKTNKSANGNWLDVLGYSNIFQNEKVNFIIGIVILCLSVFGIISFISYFSTGAADRSVKVHFSTKGHNGILVPVFAYGPHAEEFVGVHENAEVGNIVKNLLRW